MRSFSELTLVGTCMSNFFISRLLSHAQSTLAYISKTLMPTSACESASSFDPVADLLENSRLGRRVIRVETFRIDPVVDVVGCKARSSCNAYVMKVAMSLWPKCAVLERLIAFRACRISGKTSGVTLSIFNASRIFRMIPMIELVERPAVVIDPAYGFC